MGMRSGLSVRGSSLFRSDLARAAWWLAALAVLTALSSGCSEQPSVSQPAEETGSASAAPQLFRRLGYRLAVPSGWSADEGYLPWRGPNPPHRSAPQFDTFTDWYEDGDPFIVVGKRPVPRGVGLDEWIADMVRRRAITYPHHQCNEVEHARTIELDGEPARARAFHCPVDGTEAVAVQVLALHDGAGWVVMCYGHHVGDIDVMERHCDGWLSSFEFLD